MLGKVITSINDCGLYKSPVKRFKRCRISQSIITDCARSNNKSLQPGIQEPCVNLSRNSKTKLKPQQNIVKKYLFTVQSSNTILAKVTNTIKHNSPFVALISKTQHCLRLLTVCPYQFYCYDSTLPLTTVDIHHCFLQLAQSSVMSSCCL